MRAAVTFEFGKNLEIGNNTWQVLRDGTTYGNPSASEMVSSYMLSLRRCKVCSIALYFP
jgi:hypothetical protein